MLKYLSYFFNFLLFATDKVFLVLNVREWKHYKTKDHEGVIIEVAIIEDNTKYEKPDGTPIEQKANLFEKLQFKIKSKNVGDVNIHPNDLVEPVNPRCTLYGAHMENLSIICDDVKVVQKSTKN